MNKKMKKILSMFFVMIGMLMIGGHQSKEVQAVKTQCTVYEGGNIGGQNYYLWGSVNWSYLVTDQQGSFMRVQKMFNQKGILIEYYDKDYNIIKSKIIDDELPMFGAFYATNDNYYIVSGQNNEEGSKDKEVYRITKYDKNWNKIGDVGIKDCNTTTPFGAGSCRMDASGKYLVIRTCHEMYKDKNGDTHQANMTIQVNMETMKVTDIASGVSNWETGYISHSFNQFIKIENNQLITLDHGDAHPRSFVMLKYPTDISKGKFSGSTCKKVDIMKFNGESGENTTGASVGGFEISKDHYLMAGNTVKQDNDFIKNSTRNIFIGAVDKETSEVKIHYLTNYTEGEETTQTPQLVKISETRFMVLWKRGDNVYYALLDNNGEKIGDIHNFKGELSECQPIVANGKVVWYTWDFGDIVFYEINVQDPTKKNIVEIHNGHQYEEISQTDTTVLFKCKQCGQEKTERKVKIDEVYWGKPEDEKLYPKQTIYAPVGQKMTSLIYFTALDENLEYKNNYDMDFTSSDESVVAFEQKNYRTINLNMKDVGEATITFKLKYYPQDVYKVRVLVTGPLKLKAVGADKMEARYGDTIKLSANAAGGEGTLQYRFYEEDLDGKQTTIQEYSEKSECNWKPENIGNKTIYVDVKDKAGTIKTGTIKNICIKKAKAPQKYDLEKEYCNFKENKNVVLNLMQYLPEDLKIEDYTATIEEDINNIISNSKKIDKQKYEYSLNKGAVGSFAKIKFVIQSSNYEDIECSLVIKLESQRKISLQNGHKIKFKDDEQIVYGQKLSDLIFDDKESVFVDDDGKEIKGTLTVDHKDDYLKMNTEQVTYTFTPEDQEYKVYHGVIDINVRKATPKIKDVKADNILYDQQKTLKDIEIKNAKALASINGKEKEIKGIWKWKEADQHLTLGKSNKTLIFIPEDEDNFNNSEISVEVETNVKIESDKQEVTIGDEITFFTKTTNSEFTYKFYGKDPKGNDMLLANYSNNSQFTWTAFSSGKHTIYIDIKEKSGHTQTASLDIQVNKKKAPQINDIYKTYCNQTSNLSEYLDLESKMPKDIELTIYEAKLENSDSNVVSNSRMISGNGLYIYDVNDNGKVGEKATVHFKITSANYEDIKFDLNIELVDQEELKLKEGHQVVPNNDKLIYGEKLDELYIDNNKNECFVDKKGNQINGYFYINDFDMIPEIGTMEVEYTFKPFDKKYKDYQGKIKINVEKATPDLGYFFEREEDIYIQGEKAIDYIPKGVENIAYVLYGNESKAITGRWICKNPDQKIKIGKNEIQLIYMPDDLIHYNCIETTKIVMVSSIDEKKETIIKKGIKTTRDGVTYRVKVSGKSNQAEAEIVKVTNKNNYSIPDYVTINGVKCKITSITKKAFYKKTKLKKITIGKNVRTIEDNAFYGCKNLKSIMIRSIGLKKIGKSAIKGIYRKATIKVPMKQYKQYKKMFGKKTGFKKTMKLKK